MQAAHQAPARDFGHDVAQAVVGVTGSGGVVKGQERTGERLKQKQEKGHAAEHLMPAAGRRNLFVQEIADGGLDPGAVIEPDLRPFLPLHDFWSCDPCNAPSSSFPFSIFVS